MKLFRFLTSLAFLLMSTCWIVNGSEGIDAELDDESNIEAQFERDRASTSKFNKKIDTSKIEKSWEYGDDKEELEHEFELQKKVAAKRSKRKGGGGFDTSDPKKFAEQYKKDPLSFTAGAGGNGGTVMAFIELTKTKSNGKSWTKGDIDNLASKWTGMLKSGSLPGNVYNIGKDQKAAKSSIEDDPRLLVSIDKDWMVVDLMKFILKQPETVKITKDSKDYTKANLGISDDGDDDDL